MQMASALPAPFDVDALKDLALQRCAQALHVLKPVLPCGLVQSFERSNAELAIELEHFLRPQARNGQELKDACRDVLSHRLWARVCPGLVKLGDDVGDGGADARDFTQPIVCDD